MHTASQAAAQVYIKVQYHRSDPAGVNVELQTASTNSFIEQESRLAYGKAVLCS